MQRRHRSCLIAVGIFSLVGSFAGNLRAQQGAAEAAVEFSAQQIEFFETEIRPLLASRCWKCHGENKQQGGLRLDSRAAILAGGDLGPAAMLSDPATSRIVEYVGYAGDIKMPPTGKLSDREIAAVGRWVRDGLAWPATDPTKPVAASGSPGADKIPRPVPWSFQPVVDPPVPEVRQADWCRSAIDRFIVSRLEAAGLEPAPQADKRTLLRRAKFDLLGLPPTPAEIDAFLADDAPDAFARLIDRCLASPEYGQRWGRHWLDVARYADSNGQDENLAYVNAFRYRDYVVDAFNRDKAYDQFVREQIAGDLLPTSASDNERFERLIATGFLTLGPKMLAEDDPVKMEMDIVDEQVDAIGGAFLGLTLGCARCHDHKFDPVSTADYYALAGILKSTQTMDNFKVVARWHERPLASAEEVGKASAHEAVLAAKKADLAALAGGANADPEAKVRIEKELAALEKEGPPPLPAAMAVEEGKATDLAIHIRGSHLALGEMVPRGFPRSLGGHSHPLPADSSGRLELAQWITNPEHPLTARVMANRIWRWHFGAGILRSTDNFGNLGDRPSHPQLLDWLAARFVESGWSVKTVHRLIMLSATYQMSTTFNAAAAEADPDNRLLWRMNRRRLEAEAVRDALLLVAGQLDTSLGGTLLDAKPRAYVTSTASVNGTSYQTNRRSVYLPVVRSAVYDAFQAFDFAEPTTIKGDRENTTIASQALFMMNSDVMNEQSSRLAARLLSDHADDRRARVRELYFAAVARRPTEAEIDRAIAFVDRYAVTSAAGGSAGDAVAWQALCRVLLSSNEFLYVE